MPSRKFRNLQAAREKRRLEISNSLPNPGASGVELSSSIDTVQSLPTMAAEPDCGDLHESADLINMSPMERKALSRGLPVKFVLHQKSVAQVPRELFVAASSKGATIINSKNEVLLPVGYTEASVTSLVDLVQWLNRSITRNKVFPHRVNRDLAKAITLYHVAEDLGLVRYIDNTMNFFRKAIRERIPSHQDLEIVEELCPDSNDLFLNMFADRIAYLIRKKQLPTEIDYIGMVATFEKVDKAVHEHNSIYEERQVQIAAAIARRQERAEQYRQYKEREARRQARRQSQDQRQDNQRKGNWGDRRWNDAEVKQIREALLPKIDQKIVPLTAEERTNALWFKYVKKDPAFSMVA